jgi:hypothetical protein
MTHKFTTPATTTSLPSLTLSNNPSFCHSFHLSSLHLLLLSPLSSLLRTSLILPPRSSRLIHSNQLSTLSVVFTSNTSLSFSSSSPHIFLSPSHIPLRNSPVQPLSSPLPSTLPTFSLCPLLPFFPSPSTSLSSLCPSPLSLSGSPGCIHLHSYSHFLLLFVPPLVTLHLTFPCLSLSSRSSLSFFSPSFSCHSILLTSLHWL